MDTLDAPTAGRANRARAKWLIAGALIIVDALAAGCGASEPSSVTASPTNTIAATSPQAASTLTGKWRDEKSNVYEFVSSGAGSYSAQVVDAAGGICTPINIKVTERAGHFEGTMAFYKVVNSTCGEYLGDGTVSIELNAAGSIAKVSWAGPTAGGNCLNCTPHTWTRQT